MHRKDLAVCFWKKGNVCIYTCTFCSSVFLNFFLVIYQKCTCAWCRRVYSSLSLVLRFGSTTTMSTELYLGRTEDVCFCRVYISEQVCLWWSLAIRMHKHQIFELNANPNLDLGNLFYGCLVPWFVLCCNLAEKLTTATIVSGWMFVLVPAHLGRP